MWYLNIYTINFILILTLYPIEVNEIILIFKSETFKNVSLNKGRMFHE